MEVTTHEPWSKSLSPPRPQQRNHPHSHIAPIFLLQVLRDLRGGPSTQLPLVLPALGQTWSLPKIEFTELPRFWLLSFDCWHQHYIQYTSMMLCLIWKVDGVSSWEVSIKHFKNPLAPWFSRVLGLVPASAQVLRIHCYPCNAEATWPSPKYHGSCLAQNMQNRTPVRKNQPEFHHQPKRGPNAQSLLLPEISRVTGWSVHFPGWAWVLNLLSLSDFLSCACSTPADSALKHHGRSTARQFLTLSDYG